MGKETILITGGVRSGKSQYAEGRAAALGTRLLYLATAEAKDEEMARRIAEHRKRRGENWITVEEPLEIGRELLRHRGRVDCAVVDCLTLWVSNLLIQGDEAGVRRAVEGLVEVVPQIDFHLLWVTNEVGSGIVPDNALARQFCDLSGWTNQRMGGVAREVVLMVAGIPLVIKKDRSATGSQSSVLDQKLKADR